MSDIGQIFIALIMIAGGYVVSLLGVNWMTQRTARQILSDMERRGARDESSAIALNIEQRSLFSVGLRDYRPRALEYLVQQSLVVRTEDGRYYVKRTA